MRKIIGLLTFRFQRRAASNWRLVFEQSRLNGGTYDGDGLEPVSWRWPSGTWLQERLSAQRSTRG